MRSHGTRTLLRRSRRSRRSCLRHSKSRDHSRAATTSPRSWPVRNLRGVHSFLSNSVLFLLVSPYPFSHSTERNERGVRSHGTRSSSLHVLSLSVSLSLSLARSLFFHPSRVARGCLRAVFLALVFSFALPFSFSLSLLVQLIYIYMTEYLTNIMLLIIF